MAPARECQLSLSTMEEARRAADLRVFGGTSRLAVRRSALQRALPVPEELPFFDNFIFTQALAISGAVLLAEPLCYYRLHSGNLYASASVDRAWLERRYTLQSGLTKHLPPRLRSLGVPEAIVHATLAEDSIDRDRLRLTLKGGKPWETFRVERAFYRTTYKRSSAGYFLFKWLVLLVTLLVPPKTFYKLRKMYTRNGLSRIRRRLGHATPAVPEAIARRSV